MISLDYHSHYSFIIGQLKLIENTELSMIKKKNTDNRIDFDADYKMGMALFNDNWILIFMA